MATGNASQYRRGWPEQLPTELTRWQQAGPVTPEQPRLGLLRAAVAGPGLVDGEPCVAVSQWQAGAPAAPPRRCVQRHPLMVE